MVRPAVGKARERSSATLLRALLALPAPLKRRLAGPPIRRGGLIVDLDTQVLLRLAERDPEPPLRTLTPAQARARLRRLGGRVVAAPGAAMAEVRSLQVAGGAGALAARLYVPEEAVAGGEAR